MWKSPDASKGPIFHIQSFEAGKALLKLCKVNYKLIHISLTQTNKPA